MSRFTLSYTYLPSKKKAPQENQPTTWRFVQGLKAVYARAPLVSDPHTIMSQVPKESRYFSVIDLANAFFSIPVHKDSQFWFAFTFKGRSWTWTRAPMGCCESPGIFSATLYDDL